MGHKIASDKLRDSRDTQTRHGRKQMYTGQLVSTLLQNMCCIVKYGYQCMITLGLCSEKLAFVGSWNGSKHTREESDQIGAGGEQIGVCLCGVLGLLVYRLKDKVGDDGG
jgi:hypothetical protein